MDRFRKEIGDLEDEDNPDRIRVSPLVYDVLVEEINDMARIDNRSDIRGNLHILGVYIEKDDELYAFETDYGG